MKKGEVPRHGGVNSAESGKRVVSKVEPSWVNADVARIVTQGC